MLVEAGRDYSPSSQKRASFSEKGCVRKMVFCVVCFFFFCKRVVKRKEKSGFFELKMWTKQTFEVRVRRKWRNWGSPEKAVRTPP